MKEHVNFYENIKEANMRITNTLVTYDGDPYFVLTVCDHNPDGIFRVYLDPLTPDNGRLAHQKYDIPFTWHDEPGGYTRGEKMDKWLESADGKQSGVLRKMMNSPKFNKFRPFPLGMQNIDGGTTYLERKPCRFTQQGIMETMLNVTPLQFGLDSGSRKPRLDRTRTFSFLGAEMYNTVKGIYPSAEECLEQFKDDKIKNKAVGFHRDFAFVRGPLGLLYLAYKNDIVGFVPGIDNTEVKLGRENQHLKEIVQELNVFDKVS